MSMKPGLNLGVSQLLAKLLVRYGRVYIKNYASERKCSVAKNMKNTQQQLMELKSIEISISILLVIPGVSECRGACPERDIGETSRSAFVTDKNILVLVTRPLIFMLDSRSRPAQSTNAL